MTQMRKKAVYEDSLAYLNLVKQEYIGYTNEIKRKECELRLALEWMEVKVGSKMQLVRNFRKNYSYCGLLHLCLVFARVVRLKLAQAGLLGTKGNRLVSNKDYLKGNPV